VSGEPAAAAAEVPEPAAEREDSALIAQRRTRLALAILLGLLLALAGVAIFASWRLYTTAENRYVKEAFPLRTYARDVILEMLNQETAVRGYLITGDRANLEPHAQAQSALASDLAGLKRLSGRRPEIAADVADAQQYVRALQRYFRGEIALAGRGAAGRRQAQARVLAGKARFDSFRVVADRLLARSEAIVREARENQRRGFRRTLVFVVAVGAAAAAIALALLLWLPERLRRLYRREQDARQAAERGARAARSLGHVAEAVVLLDAQDVVRYWNEAAATRLGVGDAQALDRPAREAIPELDSIEQALARGGSAVVPLVRDGEERWFAAQAGDFPDGKVLVLRDVTAEQQLERARGEFVSTASHELRTRLAAVYGAVRTLRRPDRPADPELDDQLLTIIEQESQRLSAIIEQILVSAQLDEGELRLDRQECELRGLCESALASAALRASPAHVLALDAPHAVSVECDPVRLRQVLANLLDNAVKYSPDGGRIVVRVLEDGGGVTIEVADEGIGIPTDARPRVFEKFYRADPNMLGGVGGSGLGLYISRELVERMGGSIEVRSDGDTGSTFVVRLSPTAAPTGP
jgi:signal transduction histidine kinase